MIEDVESLGAKLQVDLFSQMKLTAQGQVDLPCRQSSDHVTTQAPLLRSRRRGKRIFVDDSAARDIRIVEIDGNTENQIHATRYLRAVNRIRDRSRRYVQRQCRLQIEARVDRPATEHGFRKAIVAWRRNVVSNSAG